MAVYCLTVKALQPDFLNELIASRLQVIFDIGAGVMRTAAEVSAYLVDGAFSNEILLNKVLHLVGDVERWKMSDEGDERSDPVQSLARQVNESLSQNEIT